VESKMIPQKKMTLLCLNRSIMQ